MCIRDSSYVGIALGEIPGLAIDRTGVALLGAMRAVGRRIAARG